MQELEGQIGHRFTDGGLLEQALTHRSYCNEHKNAKHNERLEFLGDAVLQLLVIEYLYQSFPDSKEGLLSKYTSALVREESLAQVANTLSLKRYLRLSRGCSASSSVLGDTVEAIIGALYIDGGQKVAQAFVERYIVVRLKDIIDEGSWQDAKSGLNETAQALGFDPPQYDTVCVEEGAQRRVFCSTVFIGTEKRGEGVGGTKQAAEQAAARKALEALEQ